MQTGGPHRRSPFSGQSEPLSILSVTSLGDDENVLVKFNGKVTYASGTFPLELFDGASWNPNTGAITNTAIDTWQVHYDSGNAEAGFPWRILTNGTAVAANRSLIVPESGTVL